MSSPAPAVTPLARLLALVAVVAALIASLLPALVLAQPAVAAPASVATGALDWGFKESFRNYVSRGGGPAGTEGIELVDGAARNADGTFRFPLASGDVDLEAGSTELQFSGGVHFFHHASADGSWLLEINLRDPRLVITDDHQALFATVQSREIRYSGAAGPMRDLGEIQLAGLEIAEAQVATQEDVTTWSAVRTFATSEVAVAFGHAYPEGTVLDTLTFTHDGPAGRPDLGDPEWATPGSPLLSAGPAATFEGVTDNPQAAYLDESAGLLYAIGNNVIHVVDTATMTRLNAEPHNAHTGPGQTGRFVLNRRAFDAEGGWLFTVGQHTANGHGEIQATRWNRETGVFETRLVSAPPELAQTVVGERSRGVVWITWDGVNDRLVALLRTNATVEPDIDQRFRIVTWTRDGAGDWQETSHVAVQPPITDATWASGGGTSVSGYTGWWGNNGATPSGSYETVAVDGTGAVIVPRWAVTGYGAEAAGPGALRIMIGEDLVTEAIPGTDDYRLAMGAPEGRVWLRKQVYVPQAFHLLELGSSADGGFGPTGRLVDFYPQEPIAHVIDEGDGMWYGVNSRSEVAAYVDGAEVTALSLPNLRLMYAAGHDEAYAYSVLGSAYTLTRVDRSGLSPTIQAQPAATSVTLPDSAGSTTATFTAAATGTPEPDVQWQAKPAGASRFTDLSGQTDTTLTLDATLANNGAQYRAVFTNAAGAIATEPAELTVLSVPEVVVEPEDQLAQLGGSAQFFALPGGSPAPEVAWQVRVGGSWSDLAPSDTVQIAGGTLTISGATAEQDGLQVRARLTNGIGTTYSRVATLSVVLPPEQDVTYTGVALEWTGNAELQHRPPDGSTAHYFSAGVSDGTGATYAASGDGIEIVQRSAGGGEAAASWATRGAHVDAAGSAAQLVRLTEGTAVVRADGSATVTWPGASFSVNFYDGLVPFTMSDLTLEVSASGAGTMTADLSGYSGDMDNPAAGKLPVAPVGDVTVATFGGVVVDTTHGFVVTPDFGGVQISVPEGKNPQNREVSGWGSWPQAFVDFHQTTNLAAYFYTTGGIFDVNKRPAGFAVGFEGAAPHVPPVTEPPTTPPPNTGGGTPPAALTQTEAGYLQWGVRGSFRSYITGPNAKGSINLSGGTSTSGGVFRFFQSGSDWNTSAGTGSASYGGAVRFAGHGGILDVTLSNPSITVSSASSATLSVEVNGSRIAMGEVNLAAATRTAVDGGVAYAGAPVALTAAGARAFSYGSSQFYSPGTVMDPVTFVIGSNAAGGGASGGGATVAAYQAPVAADVTAVDLTSSLEGCYVEGASLTWGFKESFRSYISGSIAHGDWTVADGTTYETPEFSWPNGSGVYDAGAATGQVDFTGSIRFSGHDGLLDTTVANPRLQFVDEQTAYLLLDVAGVTMEDALAGNTTEPVVATAVPFAKLDLSGGVVELSEDGSALIGTEVPTTITEEGYIAFPNYEPGTEFDPVSFNVPIGSACTGDAAAATAEAGQEEDSESWWAELAWLWGMIGGLLIAALIVAAFVLGRRAGRGASD